MPLEPVTPSEAALASQYAQRVVQDLTNVAKRIADIRTNGVAAVAAQAERDLGDGRIAPARPAQPAVSAAAIDSALGATNRQLLDDFIELVGL